ncbi:Mismatch repair endonuclease pms2 [Podila humilis]|nr:Mismatch repair endonuclease pms2 [Podila humilis]
MTSIKAIDRESVHRICSGQVVLDMATAVKELLENSLDAGSTSIVVKFKQSGLESITVTDNGSGITDENLETLALKHYTSKLKSFNDLANVRSFGFRGEALSSLCALATLTVTTSTGKTPTGVHVEYTSDGVIKSKAPAPMTKGTIVKISNLFEGMPVRRNEFVKNIKREYTKCIGLVQAYALIVPNVRISCVSQTDKKPVMTQVATSGNSSVRQNIINVFGTKAMADVIDFHLELVRGSPKPKQDNGEDEEDQDESGDIILTGHISSPSFGKGRSSADRQYVYINGRPCALPKITRVVNDVYHSFNTNQSPFLVANLIMPTSYYDVNVSPDKRTIFLHNERMIIEEIRNKLSELFEPSRSTFAVSEARQLIKKPDLAARISSGFDESVSPKKNQPGSEGTIESDDDNEGSEIGHTANTSLSSALLEPVSTMSLSSLSRDAPATTSGTNISSAEPMQSAATKPRSLKQSTLLSQVQTILTPNLLKRKTRTSFSDSEDESVQEENVVKKRDTTKISETNIQSRKESQTAKEPGVADGALDGSLPASLDVLEGYDPLDDRLNEANDPVSESDEEDAAAVPYQTSTKVQRVVVLDSEVPQDHDDRDWIEIGFDMQEHRRKRKLRMKILQETRRVEKERAEIKREQAKRRALEMLQPKQRVEATLAGNSESTGMEEDHPEESGTRRSQRIKDNRKLLSNASFANTNDDEAQKSLSRVISKSDFTRMKILGQFNRAFIVARLDSYASETTEKSVDDDDNNNNGVDDDMATSKSTKRTEPRLISSDIFVIDQHASDEKYNFEILQAKTVFSTQKLFQPKSLYLTAQEELVVLDHMKMLNKNGFYLDYDPDAPVSHRLKLVTLPVSERVVFDIQDFEELVFLLSQQAASLDGGMCDNYEKESQNGDCGGGGGGTTAPEKMVRCSKVRNLFASRACRRSVMIGHVLNHSQMKRIVRHMGEIDQPWNCPHGRPTMRHLLDLAEMEQQERRERFKSSSSSTSNGNILEDDFDEGDEELMMTRGLKNSDRTGAFDPVALKRPTQHRGSLFKQFLALPKVSV